MNWDKCDIQVDYQTKELYMIAVVLNTERDILIIIYYIYSRFVRYYESC